jgi:mono/diheme cytochrome c family protein
MNLRLTRYALLLPAALMIHVAVAADTGANARAIERGRYIVNISGCNDCHTQGYPESGGKTPRSDWLTGNPVGFQGPWGTTYPANLRLLVQSLTEKQWLVLVRKPMRPPMPWFSLQAMSDDDLRAIYQFVRHLGPKGEPAPAYAAPGQAVHTPYIVFVPQNLPKQAKK